jgi:putative sigma-54 modulation protein
MKIQVQAVHFVADDKLVGFIQKKLDKLETFYDRIVSGEVFLKLDKGDSLKVHSKWVEVNINVPGHVLFAKEKASTFEEATDLASEALKIQLKKFKDKKNEVMHAKQSATIEVLAEVEDE